jgi:hypothetical protein
MELKKRASRLTGTMNQHVRPARVQDSDAVSTALRKILPSRNPGSQRKIDSHKARQHFVGQVIDLP